MQEKAEAKKRRTRKRVSKKRHPGVSDAPLLYQDISENAHVLEGQQIPDFGETFGHRDARTTKPSIEEQGTGSVSSGCVTRSYPENTHRQAAHVLHHPQHLQPGFSAKAKLFSYVRHCNFLQKRRWVPAGGRTEQKLGGGSGVRMCMRQQPKRKTKTNDMPGTTRERRRLRPAP